MATKTLKIGSKVPDFSLKDTKGSYYTPGILNKQGLAVIFSCNHCPYVQAYEGRIMELVSEYHEKGIGFCAVNSNDVEEYPDDSYEEMVKRSRERGFNFPYLRDEDQSAAKDFGATHTPEIFLFDREGKLVYHGKIDDNWKEPEKVKNRYLKDALDEMLKGEEISMPETFSIGCTIKWKK